MEYIFAFAIFVIIFGALAVIWKLIELLEL